ncbi:MAG: hypothetical protein R3181_05505 [Rubricoccaceae bacterium]|nr:hypothetical protein [Rubricoccaceae bacterium]
MSPHRLRPFSVLLLAVIALGGCDFSDNDDVVVIGNDIIVRTFTVDGDEFDVSSDGILGSYQREVDALTEEVADDGAVLLYAGDEILFGSPQGTWTALPTTIGYDEDGDGFVDITLAFTFSYDLQDLYIDVVASSPIDFEATLPETDFRLVLIPGDLFVGNARTVDYSSYEAVRRAFALPE